RASTKIGERDVRSIVSPISLVIPSSALPITATRIGSDVVCWVIWKFLSGPCWSVAGRLVGRLDDVVALGIDGELVAVGEDDRRRRLLDDRRADDAVVALQRQAVEDVGLPGGPGEDRLA